MPLNLVTEIATKVGWLQSQVIKQQTFEARNATLLATNISSLFQNIASEYLQHSALL